MTAIAPLPYGFIKRRKIRTCKRSVSNSKRNLNSTRIKYLKMKLNILNKPCPSCKTEIKMGFYTIRENIRRCPQCGVLLVENSKRKLISGIMFFAGGFMATGSEWLGFPLLVGLLLMIISILIALKIINFTIVERDYVIKNKESNQVSYVNKTDWMEIVNNSVDSENKFEIIEHLKDKN